MQKLECRGGTFTPEGGIILRSNMSGGDKRYELRYVELYEVLRYVNDRELGN